MTRTNDKRSRLVLAADKLFHEQGVSTTTLANIAQLADVPLGNVYYYFKSKDSIVFAVIEYRRKIMHQQFEELNIIPDAKSRLSNMIRSITANKEEAAKFGDALGSLCQELAKQGGEIAVASADLMKEMLVWCSKQFDNLGKGERAQQLAANLISSLQGVSLLTLTFKDLNFAEQQIEHLIQCLEIA